MGVARSADYEKSVSPVAFDAAGGVTPQCS